MRPVRGLIVASHPLPTLAVTAFTCALAVAADAPAGRLTAAVLAGQLSVGWANDWLDAGRDRAVGRRDKPVARGDVSARTVGVAAFVALGSAVPLSLAAGRTAGLVHLAALASAWAYDLGLKRTALSPLPYAVSFALVPPWFVASSLPGTPTPRPPVVAAAALLGVSAHFANTLGDVDVDRATGVRGLPQRLGPVASARASALLLALAAALLVGLPGAPAGRIAAAGAVVAATAMAATYAGSRHLRSRWAFRCHLATVALLVAALTASGTRLVA